jgi:hypothetical protein
VDRQCPSCGGFCKKSGCERENAKPKEWVGLTDADIAQTMHGSVEGSNMLPYQFARAIEQALKEKNT